MVGGVVVRAYYYRFILQILKALLTCPYHYCAIWLTYNFLKVQSTILITHLMSSIIIILLLMLLIHQIYRLFYVQWLVDQRIINNRVIGTSIQGRFIILLPLTIEARHIALYAVSVEFVLGLTHAIAL